jgi:hypothetical protein
MSPTDVYRLAMPTGYRVLVVTCMVVLSLFGVGMLVMALTSGVPSVHLPLILFWWPRSRGIGTSCLVFHTRFASKHRGSFHLSLFAGPHRSRQRSFIPLSLIVVAAGSTSYTTKEAKFA